MSHPRIVNEIDGMTQLSYVFTSKLNQEESKYENDKASDYMTHVWWFEVLMFEERFLGCEVL